MVGPWPLALHHDLLQYIHHVHLMQRGQNRPMLQLPYDLDQLGAYTMSYHSVSLDDQYDDIVNSPHHVDWYISPFRLRFTPHATAVSLLGNCVPLG